MSAKDLLKQKNWIMLNKVLIHNLGLHPAILIGELCDKEDYFDKEGDWFFVSRDVILEDTGLSSDAQRKAGDVLIDAGILYMEKRGLPARNYYKIDDEVLYKWLTTSDSESQRQAVDISTTRDNESLQQAVEIPASYKEHIIITEDKEQNIKVPDGPGLSKNPSSETNDPRRNFRKEHEVLTDDLESGKDIDAEKQKKKKSPAEKTRDNCLAEIDKRGFDDATKEALREYYLWASSGTDVRRIKGLDLWKSKLDALEQIANKTGSKTLDIVNQSMNNKWYKFEEVGKMTSVTNTSYEPLADKVVMTDPEVAKKEYAKKLESDEGWY